MLDCQGYALFNDIWQQIDHRYPGKYSMDDLNRVIAGDEHGKQRYEIVDERIRAMFGHGN